MLDLHGYGWSILQGTVVTVEIAIGSLLIATVSGMIGAAARLSGWRLARGAAATYTTVIRGVPELVMMLLVYLTWIMSWFQPCMWVPNKMSCLPICQKCGALTLTPLIVLLLPCLSFAYNQ